MYSETIMLFKILNGKYTPADSTIYSLKVDLHDGTWSVFKTKGFKQKLKESVIKNNRKNITIKTWFDTGQIQRSAEYYNDSLVRDTSWYEHGQISSRSYNSFPNGGQMEN